MLVEPAELLRQILGCGIGISNSSQLKIVIGAVTEKKKKKKNRRVKTMQNRSSFVRVS